jgi:hypothetical protein
MGKPRGSACIVIPNTGGEQRAEPVGNPCAPDDHWESTRESIREAVLERGVHEDGHFVGAFDERDAVDASTLLIPFVGFLPFDDGRVRATIDAVEERLGRGSGLVERYEGADGLPGEEGAFLRCSFWLVDALALGGDVDTAEERFERLLDHTNSLGPLVDEVDPATGEQRGIPAGVQPHRADQLGAVPGDHPGRREPRRRADRDGPRRGSGGAGPLTSALSTARFTRCRGSCPRRPPRRGPV